MPSVDPLDIANALRANVTDARQPWLLLQPCSSVWSTIILDAGYVLCRILSNCTLTHCSLVRECSIINFCEPLLDNPRTSMWQPLLTLRVSCLVFHFESGIKTRIPDADAANISSHAHYSLNHAPSIQLFVSTLNDFSIKLSNVMSYQYDF